MPEELTPCQQRLAGLVQRVAGHGDLAAFDALYGELAAGVYSTALHACGDPGLAQDVTQEVFLEIWQTAHRYTPERGSVQAWARTIARFRAIDTVRSYQARFDREQHASWAIGDTRSPDPVAELVDDRVAQQNVRDALSTLSALQYQTVMLAYYHHLTMREIAQALDVPVPTVKSRMRGALQRLRGHLRHLDDTHHDTHRDTRHDTRHDTGTTPGTTPGTTRDTAPNATPARWKDDPCGPPSWPGSS